MGNFIATSRISAGFQSQMELANAIGKSQNWVSRIERGAAKELPPPEDVLALSKALRVSSADILAAAGYDIETGKEGDSPAIAALRPVLDRYDFDEEDIDHIRYVVEGYGRMLKKRN